jgi:hypothetical protein
VQYLGQFVEFYALKPWKISEDLSLTGLSQDDCSSEKNKRILK